jgi:hypothetical protein
MDLGGNAQYPIIDFDISTVDIGGNFTDSIPGTASYQMFDYRLSATSPCRDAGTDVSSLYPEAMTDFDGFTRVCAPYDGGNLGCPDMGAFEYVVP